MSILEVAPVSRSTLEGALAGELGDFEDAVIAESARQVNANVILTRDERGFRASSIPAHSPRSLLAVLNAA